MSEEAGASGGKTHLVTDGTYKLHIGNIQNLNQTQESKQY